MGKFLRALSGWITGFKSFWWGVFSEADNGGRVRQSAAVEDSTKQIPEWSPLGAALVAIHIADAGNVSKARKGWADA